jgi:chloramphenicol-sensitive protein RarD
VAINRGVWYALGAYIAWGLLPIYWKTLQHVPALEILAHRIVWSLVFALCILAVRRQWRWIGAALRSPRTLLTFTAISLLISVNWLVYIWAVNAGFIVETSLGYFINPLVSVLMGVVILRERLRPGQWAAIGVAAAGVIYLTVRYGSLPWIGLTLAATFATYGLLKKTARLNALDGFATETGLIALPAAAYLIFLGGQGGGELGHTSAATTALLVGTGVVTALPLIFFAAGARRIPLSTVGLLQYIAPTLAFLLGVFIYHEPFNRERLIGFSLIWLALAIYSVEGLLARRRHRMLYGYAGAGD